MGSIVSRKRKDGTFGYTAQIRIKKDGKVIHSESETFDRKPAAQAWLNKREAALAMPGVLAKVEDPPLKDVIDVYNTEKQKAHGKTKTQVLNTIKESEIGSMRCSEITSQALVRFCQQIDAQPSTRGNYMSHLASVFSVARPAWGYPLDKQAMDDARVVLDKLGLIGRSKHRTRRPTLDELNRLMAHFALIELKGRDRKKLIHMTRLVVFAIFSTRRQEEICRIVNKDLDAVHAEIIVRDMKNPGEKIGNDVTTTLTPEALQMINQQPDSDGPIWPYNSGSVSSAFTRACDLLGIEDLTFHDLRHEGISRLFEMGWSIPRVACVSGHRSWSSLKRYTHLRQTGDKYAGWIWLEKLGITQPQS